VARSGEATRLLTDRPAERQRAAPMQEQKSRGGEILFRRARAAAPPPPDFALRSGRRPVPERRVTLSAPSLREVESVPVWSRGADLAVHSPAPELRGRRAQRRPPTRRPSRPTERSRSSSEFEGVAVGARSRIGASARSAARPPRDGRLPLLQDLHRHHSVAGSVLLRTTDNQRSRRTRPTTASSRRKTSRRASMERLRRHSTAPAGATSSGRGIRCGWAGLLGPSSKRPTGTVSQQSNSRRPGCSRGRLQARPARSH
jgi:hypothetical protein